MNDEFHELAENYMKRWGVESAGVEQVAMALRKEYWRGFENGMGVM